MSDLAKRPSLDERLLSYDLSDPQAEVASRRAWPTRSR